MRAVGGFYFQATESERTDALTEFGGAGAAAEAERTGRPAELIRYADWNNALSRREGLVVTDELPYLLRHSPELPSVLQQLADEATNGVRPSARSVRALRLIAVGHDVFAAWSGTDAGTRKS